MERLPIKIKCYNHNKTFFTILSRISYTLNEYLSLFFVAIRTLPSPKNEI